MLRRMKERVVAVDHHLTRDDIGLVFADTTAAACAEILWGMTGALGVEADEGIATVLLAGLVADTGFFRFDSVTGRTLRAAAEMTDSGAKVAQMYERITQTEQPSKLALIARALASVRWAGANKVAVMTLRQKDFADVGAMVGQTEGIVNWALDVGTVEVAALLTEMPDGKIRGSLRSKHGVDVNAIARTFGGGGHAKAAGLRLEGPMEAAREQVIAATLAGMSV
jgi:phosphoesterase RecJ-like protein